MKVWREKNIFYKAVDESEKIRSILSKRENLTEDRMKFHKGKKSRICQKVEL